MAKQEKRSRAADDDDGRDEDDRPAKKKPKPEANGGNTMLFALLGGAAFVLLLCVCSGVGVAGWQFGWFGGSDKKQVAKAETDKDKAKENIDDGPPKGIGPLVTDQNFTKATQPGKTLAEVEQIMGPGQPVKGVWQEKAKAFKTFKSIRELQPDADAYQWSNDQFVYFIFFNDGAYSGHAGESLQDKAKAKTGTDKGKKGTKGRPK